MEVLELLTPYPNKAIAHTMRRANVRRWFHPTAAHPIRLQLQTNYEAGHYGHGPGPVNMMTMSQIQYRSSMKPPVHRRPSTSSTVAKTASSTSRPYSTPRTAGMYVFCTCERGRQRIGSSASEALHPIAGPVSQHAGQ